MMTINEQYQREIELAQAWAEIRDSIKSKKKRILEAQVIGLENLARGKHTEICLKVDYKGIYGYIPKSLIDDYDFKGLQSYVGANVEFVVTDTFSESEYDRLFIGDRLKALEIKAERFWRLTQVGDEVNAFVRGVDKNGIYLSVEGVQVRMEREDYSFVYHVDLREVVFIGDTIPVKIIEMDHEKKKIKVSHKEFQEDPMAYIDEYKVGSIYLGTIKNIHIDHGVFIKLEPRGIEARTGFPPGMSPELLREGEKVNFKITRIDEEARRVTGILINPRNTSKRMARAGRGSYYNAR